MQRTTAAVDKWRGICKALRVNVLYVLCYILGYLIAGENPLEKENKWTGIPSFKYLTNKLRSRAARANPSVWTIWNDYYNDKWQGPALGDSS